MDKKIEWLYVMVDWYGTLWNGNGDRPTTFKNWVQQKALASIDGGGCYTKREG